VIYLVSTVHVIVCIFLILVVLLQQGKGADLSVFGGGSTQTAFGARGATTLLHKLTVASFVLFIVTTMSIAVMQGGGRSASVMGEVMEERAEDAATATPEDLETTAPAEGDEVEVTPAAPQAPVPV
jgi:preprotein translocase subunit SecG